MITKRMPKKYIKYFFLNIKTDFYNLVSEWVDEWMSGDGSAVLTAP